MINLLYHATLYYEVCKYIQELDSKVLNTSWSWKRQRLMREIALNTKTIRLLMEEPTVHLFTTAPCYLLMPLPNVGQVAVVPAIYVAKLMSKATALLMGKSVASAKVLIISKLFVILKAQPRERQAPSRRSSFSTSNREGHPWGAIVV